MPFIIQNFDSAEDSHINDYSLYCNVKLAVRIFVPTTTHISIKSLPCTFTIKMLVNRERFRYKSGLSKVYEYAIRNLHHYIHHKRACDLFQFQLCLRSLMCVHHW